MVGNQDEGARVAWRALQTIADADERLRGILAQLALSPDEGERGLRRWLSRLADREDAPAELVTYVSDGHVERLVNIARAQTVTSSVLLRVQRQGRCLGRRPACRT